MKNILNILILFLLPVSLFAGNEDRAGSAGASQLLINPWAGSSGQASASGASATGLEAIYLNVAGLAFADKLEISLSHNQWLVGTGTMINNAGAAFKLGEGNVIGVSFMNMTYGDIEITTVDQPEGGFGTISPQNTTIGLSYARVFSNSISGGITVKILSESIPNAKAQGFAFDAGIRYTTGKNDNMRFAIALKNVGTPMRYQGDGFSQTSYIQTRDDEESFTLATRAAAFELPALINISGAYDFLFGEQSKLTINAMFIANSFTRDNYCLGLDYALKAGIATLNFRAGYMFENKIFSVIGERATALTGFSAGFGADVALGDNGSHLGLDYSYRTSNPFGGVHAIGVRLGIK